MAYYPDTPDKTKEVIDRYEQERSDMRAQVETVLHDNKQKQLVIDDFNTAYADLRTWLVKSEYGGDPTNDIYNIIYNLLEGDNKLVCEILFTLLWKYKEKLTDEGLSALMYQIDLLVFAALTPAKVNKKTYTLQEVWDLIRFKFNTLKAFYPDNGRYQFPDLETFKTLYDRAFCYRREYVIEHWDCENFARELQYFFSRFQLNSFRVLGNTPGGYHSWNMIILRDGEIIFVEPQTISWWALKDNGLMHYEPEIVIG